MVDSDEAFTPETIDKLVSVAHEEHRPVVAGLYFGTVPNPNGLMPSPIPHLYERHEDGISVVPITEYPVDSVIRVDGAGTGALLVHRSVLEKIREAADPSEGDSWCWFRDLPVNGMWLGEDLFFCRRITALGIPIHAHTGAVFSHRRKYWLDDRQHRAVREFQEAN
jgi:GT2 family glycosyltransferase